MKAASPIKSPEEAGIERPPAKIVVAASTRLITG
jgi:hypothetical protein